MVSQILVHLNSQKSRLKKSLFLSAIAVLLVSCGASKPTIKDANEAAKAIERFKKNRYPEANNKSTGKYAGSNSRTVESILNDAEKYLGTPYKFGGNTSSGFDCSGFTTKVFAENDFKLPRRSSDQAMTGKRIDLRDVKPGDLLFFATSGGSRVSHVGIVHDVNRNGEIKFIHASTSRGVIISSINEKYWNNAYLHATRVL